MENPDELLGFEEEKLSYYDLLFEAERTIDMIELEFVV